MPRLLFLSLLIFLAACSDGSSTGASKPPKPPAISTLIDRLAVTRSASAPSNATIPDKDEDDDGLRVCISSAMIEDAEESAFPDLIAHLADSRPTVPTFFGKNAGDDCTVGEGCFWLMETQVDFRWPEYQSREAPGGKRVDQPSYLATMRRDPGMPAWWEAHKSRSLVELQIESLQWSIRQEMAAGFNNDMQRHEIIDPLEKHLADLRSSK